MSRYIQLLFVLSLAALSCNLTQVLIPPTGGTALPATETPFFTEVPTQEPTPTATQPPTPTVRPTDPPQIGNVTRELDNVEKGLQEEMLELLVGTHPLFSGESLRISDGGEGLLDFGDNVRLRLFNDTLLGKIRLESAPGTPLDVRLFLENGGFTGVVTEPGGQMVVETPNGAEIKVLGTEFFIIYDPEREIAAAGNFDGGIEMGAGGEVASIPTGSFMWVGADQVISPSIQMPFSQQDFAINSRELRSPVAAFQLWGRRIDQDPPDIFSVTVDPQVILIGSECPDNPGTAEVRVEAFDDSGLTEVSVDWFQGNLSDRVALERDTGNIFSGLIGPFDEFGTVELQVRAIDLAGNASQAEPVFVRVATCVG